MPAMLFAVLGIVLVDVVLSGDNALVIGAAAGRLPRGLRLLAIFWGGLGAIFFRLVLSIAATLLLQLPLLQAIGGVLLVIIAVRLLLPETGAEKQRQPAERLLPAVLTILLADMTMSLDNVLAVGALAAGNIPLLVAGLCLSMALLFVASAMIARLVDTLPWLIDLAALVLAFTAANLVAADAYVSRWLALDAQRILALRVGLVVAMLGVDVLLRLARRHTRTKAAHTPASPPQATSIAEPPEVIVPSAARTHAPGAPDQPPQPEK